MHGRPVARTGSAPESPSHFRAMPDAYNFPQAVTKALPQQLTIDYAGPVGHEHEEKITIESLEYKVIT